MDSSSSEMDVVLANLGGKRYKSEGAAAAGEAAVSDPYGPKSLATVVAAASAAVSPVPVPRETRARRRIAAAASANTRAQSGPCVSVADLRRVTNSFYDVVFRAGLEPEVTRKVVDYAGRYEELLMKLLVENERLSGRLNVYQLSEFGQMVSSRLPTVKPSNVAVPVRGVANAPVPASAAVPAAVPAVPVPKPVETWSVKVRGKGGAATSKEVVSKVVEQFGPTLGVRLHELKTIERGGAVIKTPSVAEREKIAANKKLGPRVVVQKVHSEITPDEFMTELFEMNLKGKMPIEVFKKSIRLVSGPWKSGAGPVNVVLEGGERTISYLLETGRVYIKWFSFIVRLQNEVPHCFKCLGFDHRCRDVRMRDSVCRVFSQTGQESW